MSNEECEKVLKELDEVRPEKLNDKAKRLFEAIMTIADKKDEAEADLYEANNRINDLLDIIKQKDELIKQLCIGIREHDSLEDNICPLTEPLDCHDINKDGTCIDCIIEFYKRGVSK